MGRVHRVHCPRPAQAPRPRAQRPGRLRATPARPKHARLPRAPCTPSTHAPRTQPAPSQPIASHNTILLYCSQKLAISVTIQFLCRDTAFAACNTPLTLQYKTFLHPIACNKTLILQYNFIIFLTIQFMQ